MILKFVCYYDAYVFVAKQQLTGTQKVLNFQSLYCNVNHPSNDNK